MTVITIMAEKLDRELKARGIFGVCRAECVEIIGDVIAHAANVAERASRPEVGKSR
jgi:hypothetical protein